MKLAARYPAALLSAGLTTILAALLGAGAHAEPIPANAPPGLEPLRQFYLRDIHVLRDYRPGKNSFVEGPDRRLGYYTAPGQRLTLLELEGPGSVRHLWSTWRTGKGNHRSLKLARSRFAEQCASLPSFFGFPTNETPRPHPPARLVHLRPRR